MNKTVITTIVALAYTLLCTLAVLYHVKLKDDILQEEASKLNTKIVQLEAQVKQNEEVIKKISEYTAVNAVFIMNEKTPEGYSVVYSKLKDKYSTSTGVLSGLNNLISY